MELQRAVVTICIQFVNIILGTKKELLYYNSLYVFIGQSSYFIQDVIHYRKYTSMVKALLCAFNRTYSQIILTTVSL